MDEFVKPSENCIASFEWVLPKECFKASRVIVFIILEVSVTHCDLVIVSK